MGIEPTHKGFADLSLTTWVPRLDLSTVSFCRGKIQSEGGVRQRGPSVYNPYTPRSATFNDHLFPWRSMSVLEFSGLIGLGSLLAGFLGALTGLGGGVVVVPMLTLLFHVDIRYAIGASLVSVIATSSGAAAAYVREGYSNIRIGMFLETATTMGALAGAAIALHVSGSAIAIVFGVVLLYSAYLSSRHRDEHGPELQSSKLALKLRLNGSYPTPQGKQSYAVTGVPTGYGLMFGAGVLSGLARHRLRRGESAGHGPGHEDPVQGLDHNQQLHDWSNGRGQRRPLSGAGIHRSGNHHAGDAGGAGGIDAGSARAGESQRQSAALPVCRGDRGPGN